MTSQKEQALALLAERKRAYCLAFGNGDNPAHAAVIEDLARFCRKYRSTFHIDARLHALLEGRREVMLRIHDHLTLTVEELFVKYGKADTE